MLKQTQDKREEEIALLEKLKGYMRDDDIRALYDMQEVVRKLTEIGSTNVVQFFLDNAIWRYSKQVLFLQGMAGGGRTVALRLGPMGDALIRMKDVPLRQCVDRLTKSKDGTFEALALEYVTGRIHGKEVFLREVEKLIKTSPDPKRWQAMKERLEKNEILRLPYPEPPAANKTPVGTILDNIENKQEHGLLKPSNQ